MTINMSALPDEARKIVLDQIRKNIGFEKYNALVDAVGEDEILKIAFEQASDEMKKKEKGEKRKAWMQTVAFLLVIFGFGFVLHALFGEEIAGIVFTVLWTGWILVTSLKRVESWFAWIFGTIAGAILGAGIGAVLGIFIPAIGGAGSGAWKGALILGFVLGVVAVFLEDS